MVDRADHRQAREDLGVHRARRLDVEHVSAGGAAAQVVRTCEGREPPLGDEGDRIALLGLADVLGGHHDRAAEVPEPMQLGPDRLAEEGVKAGRRLVEEEDRRIVDERAGELETALHPAGQVRRSSFSHVPQVEQLEHRPYASPPAQQEHPEEARDEVQVLPGRQVRVQAEQLGHVADPRAGPAAEPLRDPRRAPGRTRRSGRSPPVRIFTAVVLPAPLGPIMPRRLPGGTVRLTPSSATISP